MILLFSKQFIQLLLKGAVLGERQGIELAKVVFGNVYMLIEA